MKKVALFSAQRVVTESATKSRDAIPVPLTADAEEPKSVTLRQVDAIHQLVYVKHHVAKLSPYHPRIAEPKALHHSECTTDS